LEISAVDFAMLPIENSMGGSIHDCFDLQIRHDFFIVAELKFRVRHCLMALPDETFETVKTVISHYQALAQCDQYLRGKGYEPKKEFDTSGSAKKIHDEKLKGYAAIASELAAEYHGLKILDKGIEDDPNNVTRFFLLSRQCLKIQYPLKPSKTLTDDMKTSIVFSLLDKPGCLFGALAAFSLRDLNLTKLESRPDKYRRTGHFFLPVANRKGSLGSESLNPTLVNDFYADMPEPPTGSPLLGARKSEFRSLFYIDIVGSVSDAPIVNALRHLAEMAPFLRVLGCYPMSGKLKNHVAKAVGTPDGTIISDELSRFTLDTPAIPKLSEKLLSVAPMESKRLKIAVIGFGNFGQFLAKTFVKHADVVACNRTDYSAQAKAIGVTYYNDPESLLSKEDDIDVVVISVAILAFEKIVSLLPKERLRDILVVDVLSVKVFAKTVLMAELPEDAGILCTHPMFGPESGKYSWSGLPMVYDRVRINDNETCEQERMPMSERCSLFLDIFSSENCAMVDMTCEQHDKQAADSQFITHFTGRVISRLNLASTAIATKGFKSLLTLRDQTVKDSFDLFSALYICNPNAEATLSKMRTAIKDLVVDLKSNKSKLHFNHTESSDEKKDDMERLSEFINKVSPSKTGETFGLATKLKQEGKDIVMTLCVGEPDFPPPKPILEAAKAAIDSGKTRYTPVQGILELREAIAKDLKTRKDVEADPNNILITAGGKQAIFCAILAMCDKGDQVVVPAPYWVSYPEIVRLSGAEPVIISRDPRKDFILSPIELSAVLTPNTRMIILCNPCNPTGCLYQRSDLEAIAALLSRPEYAHIYVLADEIYERLTYDGSEHISFASLPGMQHRTLIVNGFAKAYAMTGFRLGYLVAPTKILKAALKLQSQLNSCACSISQYAGVKALSLQQSELDPLYAELEKKRNLTVGRLNKIPNVYCASAKGAFYAFPDVSAYFGSNVKNPHDGSPIASTTALCQYLISYHGVALVAGDAFGEPKGIRLSFATSMEDINKAIDRLEAGLEALEIS